MKGKMAREKSNGRILHLVFAIAFFSVLLLPFGLSQAQAQIQEKKQIDKAYSWLKSTTLKNMQQMDPEQLALALLALKEKLSIDQVKTVKNILLQKSYGNGTCWPSQQCNALTTAIVKLSLNMNGNTTKAADDWLLTNTLPVDISGIDTYLQLIADDAFTCLILRGQQTEGTIEVDKGGYVVNSTHPCFLPSEYKIKLNCSNKTFEFKCTKDVRANFVFKKGNDWYVASEITEGHALTTFQLVPPQQFCIAKNNACDYEASLWAAYAFSYTSKPLANKFLLYLMASAEQNEEYLPYAFLYGMTNQSNYAKGLWSTSEVNFSSGLLSAPNSSKSIYYDTSLAALTGALRGMGMNLSVIKESLLKQQNSDGSWGKEEDKVRDTALVLYAFWPSMLSMCEEKGFSCVADCAGVGGAAVAFDCGGRGVCCDLTNAANSCELLNGNCTTNCSNSSIKVSLNCESGQCCKPLSEVTCAEINGSVCNAADKCVRNNVMISFLSVKDTSYCCNGTCTAAAKNCSELGGEKCNPAEGKSCPAGKQIVSSDGLCCQPGFCQAQLLSCKEMGGMKCSATQECVGGQLVIAADTGGQANCCIEGGKCIASSCSYKVCEIGQKCSGESYETAEGKCCKGECIEDVSCVEQNGTVCPEDKVCEDDAFITASDTTRCCTSVCKEKKAIWPTVLLVIILLGVAGAIIYLVVSGKMKGLVGALKKKKPPKPPLMPMPTKPLAMPQTKATATTAAPPIKFKELPKPPK